MHIISYPFIHYMNIIYYPYTKFTNTIYYSINYMNMLSYLTTIMYKRIGII